MTCSKECLIETLYYRLIDEAYSADGNTVRFIKRHLRKVIEDVINDSETPPALQ